MKVIVCIDDSNGMMFNKRRQTKDSILRKDILTVVADATIWMNNYSAGQFEEADFVTDISSSSDDCNSSLSIAENFLDLAGDKDFAFVENHTLKEYENKINQLIIYKWNRKYPSDFYFDIDISTDTWKQICVTEFAGSSHEKITKEIYVKS